MAGCDEKLWEILCHDINRLDSNLQRTFELETLAMLVRDTLSIHNHYSLFIYPRYRPESDTVLQDVHSTVFEGV